MTEIHFSFWAISGEIRAGIGKIQDSVESKKAEHIRRYAWLF